MSTRLDLHIRRHAIEDSTQSGEPIGRSSHVRHQSLSATPDDRHHMTPFNTPGPSMPLLITTNTTSSADSQWLDIKYNNLITSSDAGDQSWSRAPDGRQQMPTISTTNPTFITTTTSSADSQLVDTISDNDSDSDVELIGSVGPKRSARNVDIQAPPSRSVDYKCRVCGEGFKSGRALGRHMRCHQPQRAGQPAPPSSAPINTTTLSVPPKRSYSCPHIGCGKSFTNQGLVYWHMSKEHRANGTASSAHRYRRRKW
ncbi:unnamed protein product [Medioppia subpectinata]|uniref:C2H2-type domain-containing protein n=1 Tax=Medioppia subpectinata TaxID=1979941 RepID=A0A7R9Q2R5_9ACAR|nr:unnamed protein product [Medioppia subpectinata]CAG2109694.1 unnamed protein product [Medioppia subpectinata]